VFFSFGQNKPKKGMTPMIEYLHPQPGELQSLKAGPLSPHLDAFAALLMRQRYCVPGMVGKNSGWWLT
jgi:hypothetical protein